MNKTLIVALFIIMSLVLSGCQIEVKPVEQKQIIKCTNLIFDCSANDCVKQCGAFVSENNRRIVASQPVNNGQGCECTFTT
jgi:hypothetical protein